MAATSQRLGSQHLLTLLLLLVLGFGLRVHHLATVPVPNETVDEYAWTWAGMTLLEEHVPRSWSYLAGYPPVKAIMWRGHDYHIVSPWVDHPPLFALAMGTWMLAAGYHDIFAVDLGWMRWFSIWLFVANFVALFALARRYFPIDAVLLGMLGFAIAPLAVVNQKLVVSENLFVLVWMLTQLALLRYADTRRRRWVAAVGAGALALPLIKIAALGCSLHLAVLAALRRQRAAFAIVVAATLLGLAGYVAYGYHLSPTIFPQVMAAHARRFVGFASGWSMMWALKMVDHPFFYAPYIFGIVVMALDSADRKAREFWLQWLIYLLCMTFFVDQRSVYGWYTIPLYPVASLAVARGELMLMRGGRRGFLVLLWILIVVPFQPTLIHNTSPTTLTLLRWLYFGLMLVGCGTLVASELGRPRAARIVGVALVVLQIAADLYYDVTI